MKKQLLLLTGLFIGQFVFAQGNDTLATKTPPRHWKKTVSLSLNYNQTKLTNPPVGYGANQSGGSARLDLSTNFDKKKIFWNNHLSWNFGLLRFGSGPLEAGSSQKIPYQKSLDQLQISTIVGYRISADSTLSLLTGFDIFTQATPSYIDPDRKVRGVFLKNIRNSASDPIQSSFFAPANVLAYLGLGWRPSPKVFIGYSPTTYKGILVLNDTVAQLVGKVDAQGLPTATVHGNPVEMVNGVPVFRNSFNQFGSFLLANYNDKYFKGRIGISSNLRLFSNYLKEPQNIDVYWQNQLHLNIIKGLSLSYMFDLFYDHDVLVQITDDSAPGGFSGEFGQRVALQRQLMLRYQVSFKAPPNTPSRFYFKAS